MYIQAGPESVLTSKKKKTGGFRVHSGGSRERANLLHGPPRLERAPKRRFCFFSVVFSESVLAYHTALLAWKECQREVLGLV